MLPGCLVGTVPHALGTMVAHGGREPQGGLCHWIEPTLGPVPSTGHRRHARRPGRCPALIIVCARMDREHDRWTGLHRSSPSDLCLLAAAACHPGRTVVRGSDRLPIAVTCPQRPGVAVPAQYDPLPTHTPRVARVGEKAVLLDAGRTKGSVWRNTNILKSPGVRSAWRSNVNGLDK